MLIRIPPKYSVAEVTGYLKGKGAISVVRQFSGMQRNFNGENFWAKGYAVSTVGFEGSQIRAYIKNQEQLEAKEVMGKVSFRRWRWQPLELLQTSSLGTTWQSLGLLTTVKPPASRGRYDLR